jgi:hypothetical protein
MKKYQFVKHSEEYVYSTADKTVLLDIICDICQKSCRNEHTHEEYEEGDDVKEYEFTFLTIKGAFGYYSKRHDTEAWEAHICEDCSENYLEKIVCFNKHDYLSEGASNKTQAHKKYKNDFNNFLNQRANRIRKVRKMTGEVEFEIVPKNKKES